MMGVSTLVPLWALIMCLGAGSMLVIGLHISIVRRDGERQRAEQHAARVSRETVPLMSKDSENDVKAKEVLAGARKVRRDAERVHGFLNKELDKLIGGD